MNIPDKALKAAVQALFDDGCGEPKIDASTVLEAAYKFIAAQAWEQGAYAAWEKSNTAVNGETYFWTPAGAPANPYEEQS